METEAQDNQAWLNCYQSVAGVGKMQEEKPPPHKSEDWPEPPQSLSHSVQPSEKAQTSWRQSPSSRISHSSWSLRINMPTFCFSKRQVNWVLTDYYSDQGSLGWGLTLNMGFMDHCPHHVVQGPGKITLPSYLKFHCSLKRRHYKHHLNCKHFLEPGV